MSTVVGVVGDKNLLKQWNNTLEDYMINLISMYIIIIKMQYF